MRSNAAASRLPKPVSCTAAPRMRPPKIIHTAAEWNPENTVDAPESVSTIARKKKMMAVKYSGTADVAHSTIATVTMAPTCIIEGAAPAGGGRNQMTTPATTPSAATIADREKGREDMERNCAAPLSLSMRGRGLRTGNRAWPETVASRPPPRYPGR